MLFQNLYTSENLLRQCRDQYRDYKKGQWNFVAMAKWRSELAKLVTVSRQYEIRLQEIHKNYVRICEENKIETTQREKIDSKWGKALERAERIAHIFENRNRLANGEMERKTLAVQGLLAKVRIASKAEHYDSSVEFSFVPAAMEILGDETSLVNAIANIVVNAVHWAIDEPRRRQGWKRVETGKQGWVKVETRTAQGFVEIAISDNGPGMTEEVKGRVFELAQEPTEFVSTQL
jgi:signal transduction histidine kinase